MREIFKLENRCKALLNHIESYRAKRAELIISHKKERKSLIQIQNKELARQIEFKKEGGKVNLQKLKGEQKIVRESHSKCLTQIQKRFEKRNIRKTKKLLKEYEWAYEVFFNLPVFELKRKVVLFKNRFYPDKKADPEQNRKESLKYWYKNKSRIKKARIMNRPLLKNV